MNMDKFIPIELKEHLLPFNWDVERLWALSEVETILPFQALEYLLKLPFWSSKPNSGMLFDVCPKDVLQNLDAYPHQKERILKAEIKYPIDLIQHEQKFYILDGLHRLAKLSQQQKPTLRARIHELSIQAQIQR